MWYLLSGEMWGLQDVERPMVFDLMTRRMRIPKGRRKEYVVLNEELFMEGVRRYNYVVL